MGGLWRNRDFMLLWVGETVSSFGSQVSALALPLTAVVTLGASPSQMGMLQSAAYLPYIFLTLFAGVYIDRVARRPILIATNLGQGLLMLVVPLLALAGWLRMEALYLIAFLVGSMQVLFSVAWQAFLPALVGRAHLVDGNAKLHLSASGAGLVGPTLGGFLVELVTAPLALALDGISFFVAGGSLIAIRTQEERAPASLRRAPIWREIGFGFGFLFRNPYLRPMVIEAAIYNIFSNGVAALYVLYATRELGLRPAVIGTIFTAGSLCWLLGAVATGPLNRRLGLGRSMIAACAVACAAPLFIPLAGLLIGGGPLISVGALVAHAMLNGFGLAVSNIQVVSLRQAIIPPEVFGKVNATYRFINSGLVSVGPVLAGYLAEWIGLSAALAICALGVLSALPWLLFSPMTTLDRLPETSAGAPLLAKA